MDDTFPPGTVTAIVADDEPLLRESLARELRRLWPELSIVASVGDGATAIIKAMEHQPDILFLDIQMPGATGIEVAQAIAEDWPDTADGKGPPIIVFVTAFDRFAIDAFATAAIDYLLKPVKSDRLAVTIHRVQQQLLHAQHSGIATLGAQIRQLVKQQIDHQSADQANAPLKVIRASHGDTIRLIKIDEVILLESADKYVTVYTRQCEALIREPLRNLLQQLDSRQFTQIHRSAIVNLDQVEAAVKDDTGKMTLKLAGIDKTPVVSRIYRHLFQPM